MGGFSAGYWGTSESAHMVASADWIGSTGRMLLVRGRGSAGQRAVAIEASLRRGIGRGQRRQYLWPSRVCKLTLGSCPFFSLSFRTASPCICCIKHVVSSRLLSELRPLILCPVCTPGSVPCFSTEEVSAQNIEKRGIFYRKRNQRIESVGHFAIEKAEHQCPRGCAWERSVRGCATWIFTQVPSLAVASVLQSI